MRPQCRQRRREGDQRGQLHSAGLALGRLLAQAVQPLSRAGVHEASARLLVRLGGLAHRLDGGGRDEGWLRAGVRVEDDDAPLAEHLGGRAVLLAHVGGRLRRRAVEEERALREPLGPLNRHDLLRLEDDKGRALDLAHAAHFVGQNKVDLVARGACQARRRDLERRAVVGRCQASALHPLDQLLRHPWVNVDRQLEHALGRRHPDL